MVVNRGALNVETSRTRCNFIVLAGSSFLGQLLGLVYDGNVTCSSLLFELRISVHRRNDGLNLYAC